METTKGISKRGNPNISKLGVKFSKENQPEIRGRKQANYNLILKEACSKEDLIEMFKTHVTQAKEGNVNSFKIIAEYFLGKPEMLNAVESDSNTYVQQNITNLFSSAESVSNEALLSLLQQNNSEVIEIKEEKES